MILVRIKVLDKNNIHKCIGKFTSFHFSFITFFLNFPLNKARKFPLSLHPLSRV